MFYYIINILNIVILTAKLIWFLIFLKLYHKSYFTTKIGAHSLKNKLLSLEIVGIKLGQYIISRNDLVNSEAREVLAFFLDKVDEHSYKQSVHILKSDPAFDNSNLCHLSRNVLGSGSIAQVHDYGEKVIKIIHPQCRNLKYYINSLNIILKYSSKHFLINIEWKAFLELLNEQTNLENEAITMKHFYSCFKDYKEIEVPEVFSFGKYFIIMSKVYGIPLSDETAVNSSLSRNKIINYKNNLTSFLLYSCITNNICHGDLHKGNIFVKENGFISVVDYGLVIRQDNSFEGIISFWESVVTKDFDSIVKFLSYLLCSNDLNNNKVNSQYISQLFLNHLNRYDLDITETSPDLQLKFLLTFLQENKLIVKGRTLQFIIQFIILDPQDILRVIQFMQRKYFFASNCGYKLKNIKQYIEKSFKIKKTQ